MAFQTVAVTDVRRGLRVILAGLTRPLFVTQRGRVRAVLLDIEAYNNLLDELDDARLAADPEIRRVMADVKDTYKRGEMVPLEDALGHAP